MRRLLAALLLTALALSACAPQTPAREPALWRIADADSEIWLFGSAHILPPDLRWRGPRLDAAFAAADELVTETATGAEGAADLQALAERHGAQPAGRTLSAELAPEDRARLSRVGAELGLDLAALERLRPWLAALQLSYAYALREGHRHEAGVEAVLTAEARARGMRLSYFETPAEQIAVLATLPEADALAFLSATLRQIESDGDDLDALDAAWAAGDVAALESELERQWADASPALYEAVIARRNRAWADAIAARLEGSGRILVVVGAAHLVGDDSVVALLRARGIAVEGP